MATPLRWPHRPNLLSCPIQCLCQVCDHSRIHKSYRDKTYVKPSNDNVSACVLWIASLTHRLGGCYSAVGRSSESSTATAAVWVVSRMLAHAAFTLDLSAHLPSACASLKALCAR